MNQTERAARLMPNGEPRWVRCYDNGGDTFDRYTVVYTGRYPGERQYVGMSETPFDPQGFGQHGTCTHTIDALYGWPPAIGRRCHLGERIPFAALPPRCRELVLSDYRDIWNIPDGPGPA